MCDPLDIIFQALTGCRTREGLLCLASMVPGQEAVECRAHGDAANSEDLSQLTAETIQDRVDRPVLLVASSDFCVIDIVEPNACPCGACPEDSGPRHLRVFPGRSRSVRFAARILAGHGWGMTGQAARKPFGNQRPNRLSFSPAVAAGQTEPPYPTVLPCPHRLETEFVDSCISSLDAVSSQWSEQPWQDLEATVLSLVALVILQDAGFFSGDPEFLYRYLFGSASPELAAGGPAELPADIPLASSVLSSRLQALLSMLAGAGRTVGLRSRVHHTAFTASVDLPWNGPLAFLTPPPGTRVPGSVAALLIGGRDRSGLLSSHVFTATESRRQLTEVALGPRVLEELHERMRDSRVPGSTRPTARERGGIYHTPEVEARLMARLALAHRLASGPSGWPLSSDETYAWVMDPTASAPDISPSQTSCLSDVLTCLTICDPACGCGGFLVAVHDEVLRLRRAHARPIAHSGGSETGAGFSGPLLLGVDTDRRALAIADFRLRLAVSGGSGLRPDARVRLCHGDSLLGLSDLPSCLPGGFSWSSEVPSGASGSGSGRTWGGFDIVIGNPPYVRHERIVASEVKLGAPALPYKEEIRRLVGSVRPIPVQAATDAGNTLLLSGRSDLYAYFLAAGLSLARTGGSLCFVVPDTWLDTAFGADVRKMITRECLDALIIENRARRSFASADVNTVIILCRPGPPDGAATVRFASSRTPFARLGTGRTLARFLNSSRATFDEPDLSGRICSPPVGRGPWGSRHLRMPLFLDRLLDSERLVPLRSFVRLHYGSKPGISGFFLLSRQRAASLGIEPEYLRLMLRSVQEIQRPVVSESALGYAFVCGRTVQELDALDHRGAAEYVRWGARQHSGRGAKHTKAGVAWPEVVSVRGNRPGWHCFRPAPAGHFLVPCLLDKRFVVAHNPQRVLASNMFFHGAFQDGMEPAFGLALIHSTLGLLMLEVHGRTKGLGGLNLYGYDLETTLMPDPQRFVLQDRAALAEAFCALSRRPVMDIFAETGVSPTGIVTDPPADRQAIDGIIADVIGLSGVELQTVRRSLARMAADRLARAGRPMMPAG